MVGPPSRMRLYTRRCRSRRARGRARRYHARMTIALGCMGLSGVYGKTDDAQSIALIHAAIERGITLLDTGDFYGNGHNELLIGKAIAGRRDRVQLSVKFGALRGPDGSWGGF